MRYRQFSDNLVDAMAYHMKQLEDESSAGAKQSFVAEQVRRQQDTLQVGRLLSLYIDDSVPDPTPIASGLVAHPAERAYTFQSDGKMIDLDALVVGLELG